MTLITQRHKFQKVAAIEIFDVILIFSSLQLEVSVSFHVVIKDIAYCCS